MHDESSTGERWLPVVGFPDYEVSDHGRVRSWRRAGPGGTVVRPARVLRPDVDHLGRGLVTLCAGRNEKHRRLVHHLVLEAFVGPRPACMECCHNDGDPTNNRPANLRWDHHRANMADQRRHGTDPRGERNPKARLTEQQVREIRARFAAGGHTHATLAHEYGVGRSTVGRAVRGECWQDVK